MRALQPHDGDLHTENTQSLAVESSEPVAPGPGGRDGWDPSKVQDVALKMEGNPSKMHGIQIRSERSLPVTSCSLGEPLVPNITGAHTNAYMSQRIQ